MAKNVSNISTKAQILEAYEELLKEIKEERSQNAALQRELEKKRSAVAAVAEQTKAGAGVGVQDLRRLLNEQLDQLERGLVEEQRKFQDLQEAIRLEKQTLEEVYKVKAEAESLEALITTNKQAREKLESDLSARKVGLEAEIEETRKKWKREQEDYEYNLRLLRRKEEDEYKEKKQKLEKELTEKKQEHDRAVAEREKNLAEREEELQNLRKQSADFDKILQKAVKDAETLVSQRLTQEFEYRQRLEQKDLEGELKLRDQLIENLRAKIQEQQELINSLSSKSDQANQQVKDIALKAIENSGVRAFNMAGERSREDRKEN